MMSHPAMAKSYGLCQHKLVASGDSSQDTTEFIADLSSLIEKRYLTVQELEPFLKQLELGSLINPIPKKAGIKYEMPHEEYEKLLESGSIDIGKIKNWVNTFIKKIANEEADRQSTTDKTLLVPYAISSKGYQFFKIAHPVLGQAVKILRPKGNPLLESDYLPILWSLHPSQVYLYNHSEHNTKEGVGKDADARAYCLQLGAGADLPTKGDFLELRSLFEERESSDTYGWNPVKHVIELSGLGWGEYYSVFREKIPNALNENYWTSTSDLGGEDDGVKIGWAFFFKAWRNLRIANGPGREQLALARCVYKDPAVQAKERVNEKPWWFRLF